MKYEMRLVQWRDSLGSQGAWTTLKEVEGYEPELVTTVGFVVKETEDFVTMVQSYDSDEDDRRIDHFMCIPKFAITKSRVLK